MSKTSVLVVSLLTAVGLSLAAQVQISIIDFAFSPDSVVINTGDSVKWTNNGTVPHTSTSGVSGVWDSLWDSGDITPGGGTFVHGFPASGKFRFFCRHHWSLGMKGVVVVGTGSGAKEAPAGNPVGLKLAASPSPFRTSTTISYLLPKLGPATITVMDAEGRVVRTFSIAHPASSVSWDGGDDVGRTQLAGVYFIRLSTTLGTMNAKVLLQR